jgi:hypothetical protein
VQMIRSSEKSVIVHQSKGHIILRDSIFILVVVRNCNLAIHWHCCCTPAAMFDLSSLRGCAQVSACADLDVDPILVYSASASEATSISSSISAELVMDTSAVSAVCFTAARCSPLKYLSRFCYSPAECIRITLG